MPSLIYAIGDLHGRYDLLVTALAWIEADRADGDAITLVFLGDYIDRGPESRAVLERLMQEPIRPADRIICLLGNHEEMLLRAVEFGGAAFDYWMDNGGDATMRGYFWSDLPNSHLDWLHSLPTSHEDRHRVFVHAGLRPGRTIAEQRTVDKLWIREPFLSAEHDFGKHVVHGHTPVVAGPDLCPFRTNLDTGSFFTGRQGIAVFDDDIPGGPVRTAVVTVDWW